MTAFLPVDLIQTLLITTLVIYIVFGEKCPDSNITHIDWPTLNSHGEIPDFGYEITFDQFNLEVVIDVNLTYLGYSIDKDGNNLGTTYILDFESAESHIVPLNEPGTCSNRNSTDFVNTDFTEWFNYNTYNPPIVGTSTYLAYPPSSRDWFIDSYDCKTISYKGHFSYKELYNECTNYEGTQKYSVLTTDDNWINLTLTFYINIVSPLSSEYDTGFYRIYQLLSAPFVVAIRKTIEVLQPVGIRLFTMSVIAVYKENEQQGFRLAVVTEAAEYLKLSAPVLVTYPWDLTTNHQISFHINDEFVDPLTDITYTENPCLNSKAYLCSQIWEIDADNVPCPPSDFSGLYGLQFTAICNDDASSNATVNEQRATSCAIWLNAVNETVDLSTDLSWSDDVCDVQVWKITFGGLTRFYSDATYSTLNDDTYLYTIGENERIYVETEVIVPSGAYNVFKAQLVNVWLCTTDPLIGGPTLDTSTGEGGCLSANVDDDGPYHIVQNHDDVLLYNATHEADSEDTNIVRYSFIAPVSIRRDTLYIHAQVTLSLINTQRRLIESHTVGVVSKPFAEKTDQIKHFMGDIKVDPAESQPYQHIKEIENYKKESGFYEKHPLKKDDRFINIIREEDHENKEPEFVMDGGVLLENGFVFFLPLIVCLVFANIACLSYANCKQYHQNVDYSQQLVY